MFALLLGAGFSKWAADLPVARQLFDFDIRPWGEREPQRLERVRALKQYWDERQPGAQEEDFVAYALRLPRRNRERVLWYIGRRLSEPFFYFQSWRRRYVLSIDEARRLAPAGVVKAGDFLHPFVQRAGWSMSGIITTNYEMLIEYALGSRLFNYGVPGQKLVGHASWQHLGGPVTLKGHVRVAKIHGSISWDQNGTHYSEGRRALTGRALIVAPAPKSNARRR